MTTLKYPMSIQGIILSKFWFGFDLDDTLHEFRRASANASVRVFETIHASNNKTSVDTLKNTYQDILRNTTANAFTDGRTSSEYRRERFGRLLQTHGLTDDSFLSRLLEEWTVQELGIRPYIDVLVTTNEVGKSKIDGLFGAVLEKYGIAAEDIVYFGDNAIRDVQAARQEGILAVLYDEKQQSRFYDISALRVDSWAIVEKVLVHGDI
ncbi:hypothetical protein DTO013E5_5184 [Penicillium roqueforti]|nr:hypothetical protein CBS147337_3319 [Penicillium roqueforti]KAI2722192.1 hypothetical protein CBS147318_2807 [Penicillium roqueforti]KAI2725149.1 hypothetical protein CBS147354_5102 [Penicillium roqueforti]KAI2741763.1 hypothetical protein DTO012A1_4325 [Penicillium roqueforti]KAI2750307.1 hypothetical protein DTO013F2_4770 [Penicillium roqueforti]